MGTERFDADAPGTDAGTDDETSVEVDLRPPAEVFARVVLLGALLRRIFLESDAADEAEDPEAERFDLATWIRTEGIDRFATPRELAQLDAPLGRLTEAEVAATIWASEAIAALAWAIGLLEAPPPPDETVDAAPLLTELPVPWDRLGDSVARGTCRSEDAIGRERERAELWHWRALFELDARAAGTGERAEERAAVAVVAAETGRAGLLDGPIGDDFPVDGRPFRSLPSDRVDLIAVVSSARLRALNWLCGFGRSWDDVPLDV